MKSTEYGHYFEVLLHVEQEQQVNPEQTETSLEDEDSITEDELDNTLTRMKNGKSPSCNRIVIELIKEGCDLMK